MAIIRKGDKKAESKLRNQATKQSNERERASRKRTTAAGLDLTRSVKVNPDGTATKYGAPHEGPVSGSAVARDKRIAKRTMANQGSGVIKAGKVVKGELRKKSVPKKTGK